MAGSLKPFLWPRNFSQDKAWHGKVMWQPWVLLCKVALGKVPAHSTHPAAHSSPAQHLLPWRQPRTEGPKPQKYGNMHLNCLEEKVTACVRAPTMAFCPGDNSSGKEQRRHLFSGTTEHIFCQLQINRYLQTRPVIKGCLNHLSYFCERYN